VPVLVSRLISPICVDGTGAPTGRAQAAACARAAARRSSIRSGIFTIGIVTSSLGAHGGTICGPMTPGGTPPH